MKPLIVLGRGIEGSGCTKLAIELDTFFKSHRIESKIIAGSDKKWGRENAHVGQIYKYSFTNELEQLKKEVDECTSVIVYSVPAKNYERVCQDNFAEFLKYAHETGKKTIYFQFDHKIHSINRNMYAIPDFYSIFENFDVVLTYSPDGDFKNFCDKHGIALRHFITSHANGINCLNGMDFSVMKKYWKPLDQKIYRSVKYIGRSAAWKGPYLFRDIHEKHLRNAGYISTCEGIELSIGSLQFLMKELKPKRIVRDDTTILNAKEAAAMFEAGEEKLERNHNIYMFPPYNHDEAMERLSKNQFGIELLALVDSMSKDVIEMAMLEMTSVGSVPVFRKRWCDLFKIDGKPLSEYGSEQTGTVMLDEDAPEEAIALMNKLSDDKELYEKYRNAAYEFYSKHFSLDVVYINIFKRIDEVLKEG